MRYVRESGWLSRYSDWLRAGRRRGWSSSPDRITNFLLSTSSRLALEPIQPPTQWIAAALSPGIKRSRREADHSPPTSAKVKKMWIYTSASTIHLQGIVRILYMAVNTTLFTLPRRLQALFSKMHTLHVSVFFFLLSHHQALHIYKFKSDVLNPILIRISVRLL
jgi:hypothetical protein